MIDPKEKLVNVERLRFIAAFGIVLFHAMGSEGRQLREVGYSGLPAFLMIFSSLLVYTKRDLSLKQYVLKRVKRLLIPWLLWSVIYAVAILAKRYFIDSNCQLTVSPYLFITGTSVHLWYLPYAFFVSIIIFGVQKLYREEKAILFIAIFILLSVIFLFASSYGMATQKFPIPLPQWIFGIPAVIIGITIGLIIRINNARKRLSWMVLLLVLLGGCLLVLYLKKWTNLLIPYSVSVPLVCLAFLWKGKQDSISFELGSLTYGIYLMHPLIISGLHLFLRDTNSIIIAWIVFALSIMVTYCVRKTPFKFFV